MAITAVWRTLLNFTVVMLLAAPILAQQDGVATESIRSVEEGEPQMDDEAPTSGPSSVASETEPTSNGSIPAVPATAIGDIPTATAVIVQSTVIPPGGVSGPSATSTPVPRAPRGTR